MANHSNSRSFLASSTFGAFLAICFVVGGVARAEGEAVSDAARAHFDAGVSLLLDPDGARYEDAYREFQVAYAASRSPRILGNLGFCAMKLERDAEAIDAYTRYVDEASDIDAVERDQIKRDLTTLRSGFVRVTISVSPESATVVDVRNPVRGPPVTNVYAVDHGRVVLGLRPGRHVLRARDGSNESPAWEFEATPGAAQTRTLIVAPASVTVVPRSAPASKLTPWLLTGAGAVVLTSGAVAGLFALRGKGRMDRNCPKGECPANYDLEGEAAATRRLVTATDVLLIGGGVVAATGVTWLLLTSGEKERKPGVSSVSASSEPNVACSVVGCVASYRGVF
jgi:hypothetical protein